MARPIFINETLGSINESTVPQYTITHSDGVLDNAILALKNPITVQGTPQNADNMNNLFNFDNLESMRGNTRITIFNADGSVTENIKNTSTGIINAIRTTSFSGTTIIEVVTIYDDSGTIVLRQTTKHITFPDSSVSEVIV